MTETVTKTGGMRRRDRRALLIGAAIVGAMLGQANLVRPALASLRVMREQLVTERSLLSRETALLAAEPTLRRLRVDAKNSLAGARGRLVAGDSVAATAALTSFIADVARGTGVQLSTLEGAAPASTGGVMRLIANVRGEASWRETLAFVRTLESAGLLLRVDDLRIERGPRGGPLDGDAVVLSATIAGYAASTGERVP